MRAWLSVPSLVVTALLLAPHSGMAWNLCIQDFQTPLTESSSAPPDCATTSTIITADEFAAIKTELTTIIDNAAPETKNAISQTGYTVRIYINPRSSPRKRSVDTGNAVGWI